MATQSFNVYVCDGVQVDFALTFPFLSRTHVVAYLDGEPVSFEWMTDSLIRIEPAPENGAELLIRRETPNDTPLATFADGAVIRAPELNKVLRQALYVSQEGRDSVASAMIEDTTGNLDADGRRIVNAADPVDAQDVVTRSYGDEHYGANAAATAIAARDAAIVARNAAQAARAGAEEAEADAVAAKTLAESARDAAEQHKLDAEAAKNQTQAMLDKDKFREVVYVTSPQTINITLADSGKLFVCDPTAGDITFNMLSVASALAQTTPRFSVAIQKIGTSENVVEILPNGTDTIRGEESLSLTLDNQSAILVPDADPNPDDWAALQLGTPLLPNTVNTAQLVTGAVTNDKLEVGLNGRGYRHLSTSAPTSGDGADGDIWYKVV
ncbi:MAG: phage tail fiber protein [Ferrovibrio sp.]|uniref:phage tail fiber domain-containing protein n=1 Tax=Ferrovibrio sp. TaxID=1917215 RepID=UPI003918E185